jgi:hypothetical protein
MAGSTEEGPRGLAGDSKLLNAVKSPLRLFALVLLVVEGPLSLAALSGRLPWLAPTILIYLVVIIVTVLALVRPNALHPPSNPVVSNPPEHSLLRVTLDCGFERSLVFDVPQCLMTVFDHRRQVRYTGCPNLHLTTMGFWQFELRMPLSIGDSIQVDLVDQQGREWIVHPFAPNQITCKVRRR